MTDKIHAIGLPLPVGLGSVNCYLMGTKATGYVLVDTGSRNARRFLERALTELGCEPGNLRTIIITHGDPDHTGNARHVRSKFGAKIAIHPSDTRASNRQESFQERQLSILSKIRRAFVFRFFRSARFRPDVYLADGDNLAEYGVNATVLHVPGHSPGSIAILTASGSLFCGDLMVNRDKPVLNSLLDDATAARASVIRLKSLGVSMVYPGHGKPFPGSQLPPS